MKKIAIVLCAAVVVLACGGKKGAKGEEFVPDAGKGETPGAVSIIAQGEALVKGSDCNTCHHRVNKIIGPSHTDVAKKYEFTKDNVTLLAGKIIKGGVGVWGEVPMNGHPDLTQSDAEAMARYVLSLDDEKEH